MQNMFLQSQKRLGNSGALRIDHRRVKPISKRWADVSRDFVRDAREDGTVHLQPEHLTSFALGQCPEALSIIFNFHLKTCAYCGIKLEATRDSIRRWTATQKLELQGAENRKNPRVPTDYPAAITVLQPAQSCADARVVDASKEGLRLLVPQELATGTAIQIRMGDLFILAEVRHCRPVDGTFHAGVLIHDVFAMSC